MASNWNVPISSLKGIGPKRAQLFAKLGVPSAGALLRLYPRAYEDWSKVTPLAEAAPGETVCIRAMVGRPVKEHVIRKGMVLYKTVAYDGMREIMQRQKAEGGLVCVVSHSFEENIVRDYRANGLPEPDAVFGWGRPVEQRKPYPYPLEEIMRMYSLESRELLMIDDLKPGYDMAKSCGVDFAAVGWANDVEGIELFMRENCPFYFKTVAELALFLEK